MYLTDFHVHSDISMDSKASMWDMAQATAAQGVQAMCFTNHCDFLHGKTLKYQPRCREIVPESMQKTAALRAAHSLPLDVFVGVELAESHLFPAEAKAISESEGLDFILGSLHIIPGVGDFYYQKYTDPEAAVALFDGYLDQLQQIAELGYFDVMAHIGYCLRYLHRDGIDAELSLDRYGDKISALLRTLIDKGKGIEINCSGIRDGCGPFPSEEILRLYRDLGGEIITVGSDAHSPKNAAKCIREGFEALQNSGFTYVTIFRQRKPEFIKL